MDFATGVEKGEEVGSSSAMYTSTDDNKRRGRDIGGLGATPARH